MKMKRHTIRKIAIAAVILVAAYPLYLHWAAEKEYKQIRRFFYNLSQTIESVGAAGEIERASAYREELTQWNQETEKTLNRLFSDYQGSDNRSIDESIYIVQTLIDDIYELRNETVSLAEQLYSRRMLDSRTVNDGAEYEWRMQTLDDVTRYGLQYKKRLLRVCEAFRVTIVESDLPEKYRVYIWDDWSNRLHHYITLMGPPVDVLDITADNYKGLFRFLYEYRNYYYIDEKGDIRFHEQRHAREYHRLLLISGITWAPS